MQLRPLAGKSYAMLLVLCWALLPSSASGDTITLKSGKTVTGVVSSETPDRVTIQSPAGVLSFARDQVNTISKSSSPQVAELRQLHQESDYNALQSKLSQLDTNSLSAEEAVQVQVMQSSAARAAEIDRQKQAAAAEAVGLQRQAEMRARQSEALQARLAVHKANDEARQASRSVVVNTPKRSSATPSSNGQTMADRKKQVQSKKQRSAGSKSRTFASSPSRNSGSGKKVSAGMCRLPGGCP